MKKVKISAIKPNPENPRSITEEQFERLKRSITEFPEMLTARPLVVDENNVVLGGNMRLRALQALGYTEVPVQVAAGWTEEQKREFVIKDNVGFGEWDWDVLANEWDTAALESWGLDVWQPDAFDRFEPQERPPLKEVFGIPPTTILNSRAGEWQERKKAWKARIGEDGASREGTLAKGEMSPFKPGLSTNGVSILDPVLCEAMCNWFAVPGGTAFDPFAGDTVFGYVATECGLTFTGIELRPEQVELNNQKVGDRAMRFICDTATNVDEHIDMESQDFLFTCPPYFDLEVYSDDPRDASNQKDYSSFYELMKEALTLSAECLKPNRFAVVVVGDVRAKNGGYHGLPDHITEIMQRAGLHLLNELILVEPVGQSGAMRARNSMKHRKVFKCHQNVLVYYKGDPREVKNNHHEIDLSDAAFDE